MGEFCDRWHMIIAPGTHTQPSAASFLCQFKSNFAFRKRAYTCHCLYTVFTVEAEPVPEPAAVDPLQKQRAEHCEHVIEEDVRCDGTCHRSCKVCGSELLGWLNKAILKAGGEDCTGYKRVLVLPCW